MSPRTVARRITDGYGMSASVSSSEKFVSAPDSNDSHIRWLIQAADELVYHPYLDGERRCCARAAIDTRLLQADTQSALRMLPPHIHSDQSTVVQ